jgi:hypothetical protein
MDIEWGMGPEWQFVNMLNQDFSQALFERNAKIMLGENWIKSGEKIVISENKITIDKFKNYCDGLGAKYVNKIMTKKTKGK